MEKWFIRKEAGTKVSLAIINLMDKAFLLIILVQSSRDYLRMESLKAQVNSPLLMVKFLKETS